MELQRLQRDLEDESRGSDAAPISFSPLGFQMNKPHIFSTAKSKHFVLPVPVVPDAVGFLPSHGYEFEGDRPAQGRDEDWEDDGRQTDPLLADKWSMATLKVLSSMPSRTIGEF